jgi:hypothetical protein
MKLTINQAADVLCVRPARVRVLIASKRLDATQDKRSFRWSVDAASLKKYLATPQTAGRPRKAFTK